MINIYKIRCSAINIFNNVKFQIIIKNNNKVIIDKIINNNQTEEINLDKNNIYSINIIPSIGIYPYTITDVINTYKDDNKELNYNFYIPYQKNKKDTSITFYITDTNYPNLKLERGEIKIMGKPYQINIENGEGTQRIINGNYNVTSSVNGYNNDSIFPSNIEVDKDRTEYYFTISATGTLMLQVTENATPSGIPIVGAEFYRTDQNGTIYGSPIYTNENGIAVFNNVPYSDENPPIIYFKQTSSDGEHSFNDEVQQTTLNEETKTIEIENLKAIVRTFYLKDSNYENLPITTGNITLS